MSGLFKAWLAPEWGRVRDVLKLASPLVLAMIIQNLVHGVDMFYVGLLPNEYSIPGHAAMSPAMTIFWAVGGFVSAISVGTQAMVARRVGEGDSRGAGRVLFNSMVVALVAGTVVAIGAALLARPLFRLFTSNEQVLAVGVPFARARLLGIVALVGTMSCKSFFDGLGKTYYYLITVVIMNALNAGLSYVLMFGPLGLPPLYVTGAGIGSAISSFIGMSILIAWALRARYRVEYGILRPGNLDYGLMGRIVRLSVPSGVATLVVMSGFVFFLKWVAMLDLAVSDESDLGFNAARIEWLCSMTPFAVSHDSFVEMLRTHPPVYGAATSVIITVVMFSVMACMGIGIAAATLVSQNLGRGRPDEAARHAWTAVGIAVSVTGALGLAAVFFPDAVMGLLTKDAEVIEAGRTAMRIIGASEFLLGVGLVLAQSLFGAGNTRFVMYTELILHITCLVPLSYLLGVTAGMGVNGIWLAAAIYALVLSAVMAVKFKAGGWKTIRI